MKRRVVQHGPSSLIISLPSKWVKTFKVNKGDELDVIEKGNVLEINTSSSVAGKSITIDISGLNYASVMTYLQSMYRYGYEEINVRYSNQNTIDYATGAEVQINSAIERSAELFVGIEIVQQTKDFMQIKQISTDSEKDFEVLAKRVIFLTSEVFQEFEKSLKEPEKEDISLFESYHKSISKFVNYCMRLLNRGNFGDLSDSLTLYHLLATLKKIIDVLVDVAITRAKSNVTFSKTSENIVRQVITSVYQYQSFFFKGDLNIVDDLEKKRDSVKKAIRNMSAKSQEALLLEEFVEIVELLQDCVECRMRLSSISEIKYRKQITVIKKV